MALSSSGDTFLYTVEFVLNVNLKALLYRNSLARAVMDSLKLTFSIMHITISYLQFKFVLFQKRRGFQVKVKGRFGCGVVVVDASSRLVAQNLQKEF